MSNIEIPYFPYVYIYIMLYGGVSLVLLHVVGAWGRNPCRFRKMLVNDIWCQMITSTYLILRMSYLDIRCTILKCRIPHVYNLTWRCIWEYLFSASSISHCVCHFKGWPSASPSFNRPLEGCYSCLFDETLVCRDGHGVSQNTSLFS